MNFFFLFTHIIVPVLSVVLLTDAAKIKKKTPYPYYNQENLQHEASEEAQDFSKIPGEPGVDYPLYHSVPETSFNCGSVPYAPGIYANVETGCQAYHVCHDGREGHQGASFLCSNGTLFNQKEFTCDWWYKVDCQQAPSLYRLNAEPDTNPFVPKQKPFEEDSGENAYKATPQYQKSTSQFHKTSHHGTVPRPQYYKPAPTPYYRSTSPQYFQSNSDY